VAKSTKAPEEIVVVGATPHPLRDAYHSLLKMPWSGVIAAIAVVFLAANAVFAVGYMVTGGVVGVRPGVFRDAFFFSVQTMGTIGYGAMYPQSTGAHVLVVAESVVGLVMTALATGIVFARFSQTTGQLVFSDKATISPMDGVPTLAFRIGNDRASTIFEATVRVGVIRTEKTREGVLFYRLYEAKLVRDRTPALARSWNVMHPIDEASPLFGLSPEQCLKDELELAVTVVGTDDTSLQAVHARCRYTMKDILWGARPADVLRELPDGRLELDVRKFDEVVATEPTATFPYPREPGKPTAC
jgi:inward rectifier potassium channel